MVLNIIFSFNRALQLDYLLQSAIDRFKIDYKIVIIYHTKGNHNKGYEKLKEKYRSYPVEFLERQPTDFSRKTRIKRKLKNLIATEKPIIHKDNFKTLLEETLAKTNCEFVMFNTDDGFWYSDVSIDDGVFNLIRNNPSSVSYRMYVGENLEHFPSYVTRWNTSYLWDYYRETKTTHWSFPFAVDGTIYNTKGILEILKPVDYHNPVLLEDHVVHYVIKNKLLGIGLSPITSKLVCTKLNRVSVDTNNPTIHIHPDYLNEKFLAGYTLELVLDQEIKNSNLVPQKINLCKEGVREVIYELDEAGRLAQNNLGVEGAKQQMK